MALVPTKDSTEVVGMHGMLSQPNTEPAHAHLPCPTLSTETRTLLVVVSQVESCMTHLLNGKSRI